MFLHTSSAYLWLFLSYYHYLNCLHVNLLPVLGVIRSKSLLVNPATWQWMCMGSCGCLRSRCMLFGLQYHIGKVSIDVDCRILNNCISEVGGQCCVCIDVHACAYIQRTIKCRRDDHVFLIVFWIYTYIFEKGWVLWFQHVKDRFVLPTFRSEYSDLLQGEDVDMYILVFITRC